MRLKYPRKLKKQIGRHYSKFMPFDENNISTIHKLLDYEYCTNNAHRGYKPSYPEIVNHRLYKEI